MNLSIDYAKGATRLRLLLTEARTTLTCISGNCPALPDFALTCSLDTSDLTQKLLSAAGFQATHAFASAPARKRKRKANKP